MNTFEQYLEAQEHKKITKKEFKALTAKLVRANEGVVLNTPNYESYIAGCKKVGIKPIFSKQGFQTCYELRS